MTDDHLFGRDGIIERSIRLLKDYRRDRYTSQLKQLAELIVELRSRHTLRDGRTDWSGRSPAYRQDIGWIYRSAGIPEVELDTTEAAIRYHVGNLLRARAAGTELAAVGLKQTSPKERLDQARRDSQWRRRCTCECTCGAKQQ
jgi:hypothetical protein